MDYIVQCTSLLLYVKGSFGSFARLAVTNGGIYCLVRQLFLNFPANIEASFRIRLTRPALKFGGYCSTSWIPSIGSPEFAANNIFQIIFDGSLLNKIGFKFKITVILAKTLFQTFLWFIDIRIFFLVFTCKGHARVNPIVVNAFSWFLSQGQEEHTFRIWFVVAFCQSLTGMTEACLVL